MIVIVMVVVVVVDVIVGVDVCLSVSIVDLFRQKVERCSEEQR